MRFVFIFLFLQSTVAAKLEIEDISRDQIYLPAIGKDVSACFNGSENAALCLTKAIRNYCISDQNGEEYLNLYECLDAKIHGMCNKQHELPQGDFNDCLFYFYVVDFSLARDQCLSEANPLSCFLHEAYYLCDGKFDCIVDSLDKICYSDCSDWKKISTRMWLVSTCKGSLECISSTIKDGCGANKECSVSTIEYFCDLTNKLEQDAKNCILNINAKIEDVATGTKLEPHVQQPMQPLNKVSELPSNVEQTSDAPSWPIEEQNPEVMPVEPKLIPSENQDTIDLMTNSSNYNKTLEEPELKEKFQFEKKHWIAICACVGISLLIVAAIGFFMFWQARRDKKKNKKSGDAEKSIDKKGNKKTNKSEKSRQKASKSKKCKKSGKSKKESKEYSRKETSNGLNCKKESRKSKKEITMSNRNDTNSKTETSRKEEEKTEKGDSSGSEH